MNRVMVALGLLVALNACGGPSEIENAVSTCNDRLNVDLAAGDDGQSVSVSGSTFALPTEAERAGLATQVSLCILEELDVPDSVMAKVQDTTAMMGRQSDSWGDYTASWTYHPDHGLELVVES